MFATAVTSNKSDAFVFRRQRDSSRPRKFVTSTRILNNFIAHCSGVEFARAGSMSWICRNFHWNDSQCDQNEEDSFGSHFAREQNKTDCQVILASTILYNTYQGYVRNATKITLGGKLDYRRYSKIDKLPLSPHPEWVDDAKVIHHL